MILMLIATISTVSVLGCSFVSLNYPDRCIRHSGYLLVLDPKENTYQYQQDSSFKQVAALNGDINCISFRSVNYPDHYIRHHDYKLYLSLWEDNNQYKDDASWKKKSALHGSSDHSSFEACNLNEYYIRHKDNKLRIDKYETNQGYFEDATFTFKSVTPAWEGYTGWQFEAWKYAPLLKFDRAADEFPMNAQTAYLDNSAEVRVLDQVNNPTYYKVCGDINSPTATFSIGYWWYYGKQRLCTILGISDPTGESAHDGDWEHIIVHASHGSVVKVQYHQHGGHYTANANQIDIWSYTHPVVYVGVEGHGSYYNSNDYAGGCGYFYDYRNPKDDSDHLLTWNNIISIDDKTEEWMNSLGQCSLDNGVIGGNLVYCHGNPLKTSTNDICTADGCDDNGCDWLECDSTAELILYPANCAPAAKYETNNLDDGIDYEFELNQFNRYLLLWLVIGTLIIVNCICIAIYCYNKKGRGDKGYQVVSIDTNSEIERL